MPARPRALRLAALPVAPVSPVDRLVALARHRAAAGLLALVARVAP